MEANPVLDELIYQPASGALRFKGVRYLLIRPETIAALQQHLATRFGEEAAAEALYAAGFTGGRLSGERYRNALGLTAVEAVTFMCRMGAQLGWGRFAAVEFDEARHHLRLEVYDSPFAEAYGSTAAAGVCHLVRGVLGGLMGGLVPGEVRAEETACRAQGAAACRFEVEVRS